MNIYDIKKMFFFNVCYMFLHVYINNIKLECMLLLYEIICMYLHKKGN